MSATISIASVATEAQKTEAGNFLHDIFQAAVSLFMTVATIIKDFFTQPAVIWVMAFIVIIAWALVWVKRKQASAWM